MLHIIPENGYHPLSDKQKGADKENHLQECPLQKQCNNALHLLIHKQPQQFPSYMHQKEQNQVFLFQTPPAEQQPAPEH